MTDFEPGQRVEWRATAGQQWTTAGTYLGSDDGPRIGDSDFARVETDGEEWLVRSHLLHPEGELAAEDAELADLIERAKGYPIGDDEHAARCRQQRGPWCDTCKRPSVFSEGQGLMHSTAEHPFGVPGHLDYTEYPGHAVTHHEWYRVPR